MSFLEYIKSGGQRPDPFKLPYKLSEFENDLLFDLLSRLYNPDRELLLSLEEIPSHPLFRIHSIKPIIGNTESRYIDYEDWTARHADYHSIWRTIIPQLIDPNDYLDKRCITIFESIDLYYRFLPFVINLDELEKIAWGCILLVYLSINYDESVIRLVSNMTTIHIVDRIVKFLNGHIRDRNFYHKATAYHDYAYCWSLMGLPYDDYMKIRADRFYEVITPSRNNSDDIPTLINNIVNPLNNPLLPEFKGDRIYNTILINSMKTPPQMQPNGTIFSKLTSSEAMEFLDLYDIKYHKPSVNNIRFYLTDLAERLYIYLMVNSGPDAAVTWPILDLVKSSNINIIITHQYDLEALQNMNDVKIREFATALQLDTNDSNIKDRIIRILRMNYMIKI